MSLKNQNESDDSLLDLSKLSKESKKRKSRRRNKEPPSKLLNSSTPTIFKNVELEISDNLLNYIHKLEFLIEKSFNQLKDEREKFSNFLFCLSKNFDNCLISDISELSSCFDSPDLEEAKLCNFYEEILLKYDPNLIPKTQTITPKPSKSRPRHVKPPPIGLTPSDNYNIIKFSLNNNSSAMEKTTQISIEDTQEIPKEIPKRGRRRPQVDNTNNINIDNISNIVNITNNANKANNANNANINNNTINSNNSNNSSNKPINPRKKLKKEEPIPIPPHDLNLLSQGFINPQAQGFKNMNFPGFFNPQALASMQQFNFMNNQLMATQEQDNAINLDLAQKFNNLPFNLYSLLNDPNSKDLMGILNQTVIKDSNEMQQGLWNGQFGNGNGIDQNFIKNLKDHSKK